MKHFCVYLFCFFLAVATSVPNDDEDYSGNDYYYDYYSGSGEVGGNYDYYENLDNYYTDNEYDDNEENEDDYEDNSGMEEHELHVRPQMRSSDSNLTFYEGSNISLPCEATDAEHLVRLWLKDDEILFTASIRSLFLSHHPLYNSSITVDNCHNLVIINASKIHSGNYTCKILVAVKKIQVKHSIKVEHGTAEIEVRGHIDQRRVVLEGESVTLSCRNTSKKVHSWSREGFGKFGDNADNYSHNDSTYKIQNASRRDAGRYYCDNVLVNHLIVKFAPRISKVSKNVYYGGMGVAMLIECVVQAQPQPRVTWYKGSEVVSLDDRVVQLQSGVGRHALMFERVRNDDIGDYVCLAENELGRDQNNVLVDQDDFEKDIIYENNINTNEFDEFSNDRPDIVVENSTYEETKEMRRELKQLKERIATLESSFNTTKRNDNVSMISPSKSSSRPLEKAIFADLLSLQHQIQTVSQRLKSSLKPLQTTNSKLKDELLYIKDSLIEVKENLNVTSRTLDQLYSEDIFELMNFKGRVDNELGILKQRIQLSASDQAKNFDEVKFINITEDLRLLQRTLARIEGEKLNEAASKTRNEERFEVFNNDLKSLKTDFSDLSRKLDLLTLNQDNFRRIDEEQVLRIDRLHEQVDRLRDDVGQLDVVERQDDLDKGLKMVLHELQLLKSQVFRLKTTVFGLQLRNNSVIATSESESESELESLKSEVRMWSNATEDLRLALEKLEQERLKYNLIIQNLKSNRRVERPRHLERLLNDFFELKLNLRDVRFDEVERLENGNLRVKFPSTREKSRILATARGLKIWQVQEEFSQNVQKRRQKLMKFVRQKLETSNEKRRWALDKDQLFFDNKVYSVDQQGRIVVVRNL